MDRCSSPRMPPHLAALDDLMIFGNDHRDKTEHPGPFCRFTAPLEPDYARPGSTGHPPRAPPPVRMASPSRSHPPLPDKAADEVHTFFIHPTTFRGLGVGWNATWDDSTIAAITDEWPMRHQGQPVSVRGPGHRPALQTGPPADLLPAGRRQPCSPRTGLCRHPACLHQFHRTERPASSSPATARVPITDRASSRNSSTARPSNRG